MAAIRLPRRGPAQQNPSFPQQRQRAFVRAAPHSHSMRSALLALSFCFLAAVARAESPHHGLSVPPPSCAAVTKQTCATAQALGRGINLGNMLDAPREGDWGARVEPAFIDEAAANFTTVRLPVRWSNHAAPTADATIDEAFARRVDQVVDALLAKGVYVILDLHHYTQISGGTLHPHETAVDPSVVDVRLVNMWRQIAQRYRDRSPKLLFELLNEPHDRMNGEAWNRLAARTLAAVRESNPDRVVLIGPGEWNGIPALPQLRLPPDRNVIVSIHNYDPFNFTHQGVEWLPQHFPTGTPCCDASQRHAISNVLDQARAWSVEHGYPLYLGEFGTADKADMRSRANYARTVREEAEKRGIPWAYWGFAADFGIYSPQTHQWIEPIRRALLD
jgi:endoglucanase